MEMQPTLAAAIEGAVLALFQLRMAAAHLPEQCVQSVQRCRAGVAHQ
jgi:hypothetical protein